MSWHRRLGRRPRRLPRSRAPYPRPSVRPRTPAGGWREREERIRGLRGEVPGGELSPELWLARRGWIRQHDALGQRLLAVADPYLEVHRIRPSDEVVGWGSQDPGPLHVLHCPDPA